MNGLDDINYGPLNKLIGVWKGDKGIDIAPEPDGTENNPYYETITFEAIGDVTNAESQVLAALHYRQIVRHKSDNEVFHDETGYWMWDENSATIMHSLTIPRAVSVIAGGSHNGDQNADHERKVGHPPAVLGLKKGWQVRGAPPADRLSGAHRPLMLRRTSGPEPARRPAHLEYPHRQ